MVSRTGDEIHRLGKRPAIEPADHHGSTGMDCYLRGPAAAREPDLGTLVVSNHGRVDVPIAVDLGPAEEAHLDAAILQQRLKNVRHSADHQRTSDEGRIADGDWKPLGYRAYCARLVDQHQVGCVRAAGEIAGQIRQADSNEYDLAVAQLPGGD